MNYNYGVIGVPRDAEVSIPLLRDLGCGYVRVNIDWGDIERQRGVYDSRPLAERVLPFTQKGIKVVLTVVTRNSLFKVPGAWWSREYRSYPHAGGCPSNLPTYRSFIYNLARMLPEEVTHLQIDNEVSTDGTYWRGPVEGYAKVFREAWQGMRYAGSRALLTAAGFSSGLLEQLIRKEPYATRMVTDFLSQGLASTLDLHMYHSVDTMGKKIEWFRNRGFDNLICTETGGPDSAVEMVHPDVWEAAKAVHVEQRLSVCRAWGVSPAMWLSLFPLSGEVERFRNLGLVTEQGERTSAYWAYQSLIQDDLGGTTSTTEEV